MKRASDCLPLLAAACLLLVGCMTPPVRWRHDVGNETFAASGQSLLIVPIEDLREPRNEPRSWLGWLPLVPWTTETDRVFDRRLQTNGSWRYSVANAAIHFDARRDLHEALHRQMGIGGCFGPVFASRDEAGFWAESETEPYRLRLKLEELTLSARHLRYGLGFAAPAAFALGAPQDRLELRMNAELQLLSPAGDALYAQAIERTAAFYDTWYDRLDARQRALDFISSTLYEELNRLQFQCDSLTTQHPAKGGNGS